MKSDRMTFNPHSVPWDGVMGGMIAGVGVATYTPFFLGICTWYWRDIYKATVDEYNRLTFSNIPPNNKEIVVVNGSEDLR
jgi:hypothetical protein